MQKNTRLAGDKLERFQKQYPILRFSNTIAEIQNEETVIRFLYELNEHKFETVYNIPLVVDINDPVIDILLKYLGIVESFSYWKLTCSPQIVIEHKSLTEIEKRFFKKLLLNGMSEFLFRNALPLDISIEFKAGSGTKNSLNCENSRNSELIEGALVLVGGGKDSIVSLETLKILNGQFEIVPFSLNPIRASKDCIEISGSEKSIYAIRTIDRKLSQLNEGEFFNGHIPFSSVLSFVSSIIAYSLKLKFVISSNESSANQGNTISNGVEVNHQYSKSIEYESDLADLFLENGIPISYFSFLRPLNEIQISKIFANHKAYHSVFQSCNIQQTLKARQIIADTTNLSATDRWCGECPKCIFVYLMLNIFLTEDQLREIFGRDIAESDGFAEVARTLSDSSEIKPFECVGTFEEVDFALRFHNSFEESATKKELNEFMNYWNLDNRVPIDFVEALKKQLSVKA